MMRFKGISALMKMCAGVDCRPLGFILVGAIGFGVDAAILTVLMNGWQFEVVPARAVSFLSATLVTWILNRKITFSRRAAVDANAKKKEYFRYFSVQVVGALLNLIIFVVVISGIPALRRMPVVPLAVGAIAGLVFNFFMSHQFVFIAGQKENE